MRRDEAAVYAVTFSYMSLLSALLLIVPLYVKSLGYSHLTLGTVVAAQAILQIGTRIPAGLLSDRFGERPVLLVSFLSLAGATLLLATAGTLAAVLVSQLLMGLSRTIFWVPSMSLATRLDAQGQGKRIGLNQGTGSVAGILGPVAAGLLIQHLDYRGALWLLTGAAALSPICLLALPFMKPFGFARKPGEMAGELVAMAKRPPSYVAGWVTCLSALVRGLIISFQPVYLSAVGLGPVVIGALGAVRALSEAAVSPLAGVLTGRNRIGTVLIVGTLVAALGISWTGLLSGGIWLWVAVGLTGAGANILHVAGLNLAARDAGPGGRGLAMGFNGTFWSIGLLASPLALGALAQTLGLGATLVGSGLTFTGLGMMAWLANMRFPGRRPT